MNKCIFYDQVKELQELAGAIFLQEDLRKSHPPSLFESGNPGTSSLYPNNLASNLHWYLDHSSASALKLFDPASASTKTALLNVLDCGDAASHASRSPHFLMDDDVTMGSRSSSEPSVNNSQNNDPSFNNSQNNDSSYNIIDPNHEHSYSKSGHSKDNLIESSHDHSYSKSGHGKDSLAGNIVHNNSEPLYNSSEHIESWIHNQRSHLFDYLAKFFPKNMTPPDNSLDRIVGL